MRTVDGYGSRDGPQNLFQREDVLARRLADAIQVSHAGHAGSQSLEQRYQETGKTDLKQQLEEHTKV